MIPPTQRIVVVDLRIPFTRLMFFFVKAALAAIPAAIILGAIAMIASAAIVALLGGNIDVIMRRWMI
jgi:VIT1/CCC1 family predicted Fe2+/Mn2+ transporter